jgi:hypothetical protein
MDRRAVYWGVDPYPKGRGAIEPYRRWELPQARDLSEADLTRLLKSARGWLDTPVLSENIEGIDRKTQLCAALDLAIRTEDYGAAVHPNIYEGLLARLGGAAAGERKTAKDKTMAKKVALQTSDADKVLARLDRMAKIIQEKHKTWGMRYVVAKSLVNEIDRIADSLETVTYGPESMLARQANVMGLSKDAKVFERDSDEAYMTTFDNPMSPHQVEADEPYMKAYGDDQSSAVLSGKATNGRPLAP